MQTEGRASLNDASEGGGDRRRLTVLFALVALFVLTADVVTKIIAMAELADRDPVELFGGLLTLRLVRNSGAAFGLAEGYTVVLSLVAAAVVVVVVRLSRTLGSTTWAVAFGLLLGGALGNLSDRVFRDPGFLRGHVVDFLELPNWPVFNLADTSLVIASALIVLMALRGRRWDGTTDRADQRSVAPASAEGDDQPAERTDEPESSEREVGRGAEPVAEPGAGRAAEPAAGGAERSPEPSQVRASQDDQSAGAAE
jgi:signal peptidase II